MKIPSLSGAGSPVPKRLLFTLLLSAALAALAIGQAQAAEGENLLVSGALDEGAQGQGWSLVRGEDESRSVEAGEKQSAEGASLFLKTTKLSTHAHCFWIQSVPAEQDVRYEFSFEANGSGKDPYGVYAGVAFKGANGAYEFKRLAGVAHSAPNPEEIPPTEWKPFKAEFTVPAGFDVLETRVGLDASNPAEGAFRKIMLRRLP